MRAKEYAQMYLKSDNKNVTGVEILKMFIDETVELMNKRNIKLNSGVISLFNEQHRKYQSYASIVNGKLPIRQPLLYDGYKNAMFKVFPGLKAEIEKAVSR